MATDQPSTARAAPTTRATLGVALRGSTPAASAWARSLRSAASDIAMAAQNAR